MELFERESEERDARRQREAAGKGPERRAFETLSEVTTPVDGWHFTKLQLQGLSSLPFQLERASEGSERECLNCWRKRPSWFRERVRGGGGRRKKSSSSSSVMGSIFEQIGRAHV